MNPDDYREQIELDILAIIEEKLKKSQMNAERARVIAKYVLAALHPHMSIEQIREAVDKLDDLFPELIPVAVKTATEAEEVLKTSMLQNVSTLLKQGKINEASELLKDK